MITTLAAPIPTDNRRKIMFLQCGGDHLEHRRASSIRRAITPRRSVSFFVQRLRCVVVTSLRKPRSEHRLPYVHLAPALFAGNCVQLPPTLVRGAQLESQRLSLLREVSQRQPLQECP